ncbi:MAG: NAD(P)H-dependent oxidoreductase [Campylobacteraceae bacterium]|nr:NAD(P)H-dependent oxidoreductase [Campylobacteraceae bacterium]
MKILVISGSLRQKSFNTAIAYSLQSMNADVEVYEDLGNLPFFNADLDIHTLEVDNSPFEVQMFRAKINLCDALILCTPEYAFEIPGVLKNALDWLVSSGNLLDKPVAILSASTSKMGGNKANNLLCELVKVLMGKVDESTTLKISAVNKKFDENTLIIDEELKSHLENLLSTLEEKINNQ